MALSAAVLLFVCLRIFCMREGRESDKEVCRYDVLKESAAGYERIPMDDYLVGALAACMPETYEPEAYKAQAVLLRTRLIMIADQNQTKEIPYEQAGQNALSDTQMRARFGREYEKTRRKCEAAVRETDRMILQYHGVTAEAPYFALSAGHTRENGKMTSVSCKEDVMADDYLTEQSVPAAVFSGQMQAILETTEEVNPSQIELVRDSAGYVEWVQWNDQRISGEKVQELFSLPSSSFFIEEQKRDVVITVKGVGHGYGMSQYTANLMAQRGDNFYTILAYFFPRYEIVKK